MSIRNVMTTQRTKPTIILSAEDYERLFTLVHLQSGSGCRISPTYSPWR